MDTTNGYEFDDLYEDLELPYLFHGNFATLLVKALRYLDRETVDTIFDKTFFHVFVGGSWHLSPQLIGSRPNGAQRSVVIIDEKDLEPEQDAIVIILHEAAHSFLGHGQDVQLSKDRMMQQEDECWKQVRDWLPVEFHECILRHEQDGSGSASAGS